MKELVEILKIQIVSSNSNLRNYQFKNEVVISNCCEDLEYTTITSEKSSARWKMIIELRILREQRGPLIYATGLQIVVLCPHPSETLLKVNILYLKQS